MKNKSKLGLLVIILLSLSLLAACISAPPSALPNDQSSATTAPSASGTSGPKLSAEGHENKLYIGDLGSPQTGKAALFITSDFHLEFLMVETKNITYSTYMEGALKGQAVNMEDALTKARGTGQSVKGDVNLNLTFPGKGFVRSVVTPVDSGALYKGEFNGVIAGLMVLSDGSVYGIAAGTGGDKPVMEYLCVDGTADPTAAEITAKTCTTNQEVTLKKVSN
jgi:hypothetical protein